MPRPIKLVKSWAFEKLPRVVSVITTALNIDLGSQLFERGMTISSGQITYALDNDLSRLRLQWNMAALPPLVPSRIPPAMQAIIVKASANMKSFG